MKISITIPFHNEEKNLEILLPDLMKRLISIKKHKFEVILVDDQSSDKSYHVCQNFLKKRSKIKFKLFKLKKREGQTAALKKAFSSAVGSFIITMDADLQDEPKDINKFIKKINEGYHLILGYRLKRKSSPLLRFSIYIYDFILSIFIRKKLKSFRSEYTAYKKSYLSSLPKFKNDHRYLCPIAIYRGAYKHTEVFLEHKDRKYGQSKYNLLPKIIFGVIEVFIFIFRLKFGYYDKKK